MPTIGFGIPLYESVEGYTFIAQTALFAGWRDYTPDDWRLKGPICVRGSVIVENRNAITDALLGDGYGKVPGSDSPRSHLTTRRADVIVWNDADCFLEPEQYVSLIARLLDYRARGERVAAVGAAFPIQMDGRPSPNVMPLAGADGSPLPLTFGVGPVDVDWIGFGVLATLADVYDEMGTRAWFRHVSGDGPDAGGEDTLWCRDARAAGYRIVLDTDILGAHAYRAPHRLDDYYRNDHKGAVGAEE